MTMERGGIADYCSVHLPSSTSLLHFHTPRGYPAGPEKLEENQETKEMQI